MENIHKLRQKLNQLSSPYQAQVWDNGRFEVHQVKEDDKDRLVNSLRRISKEVHATANGKYDFSRPAMFGGMHSQYYNIYGDIEMEDKNESLQLTEGHVEQSYKGFTLDWNDDGVDPEEGIADFSVRIYFNGEEITQDAYGKELSFNGFAEAKRWIDKHVTFKKYTAKEKLDMLEAILNKDKKLSVWMEDEGFMCIDVNAYPYAYGAADFIIIVGGGDYVFKIRAGEVVNNILSNNKIDINTMANELGWDIPDEDSDDFEEIADELTQEYVFSTDLLSQEFNDISMLLEEMSKFGLTSAITKEDEIRLKKDSQIFINGKPLEEKLIQSSSNKALQQNIKTEIDSSKSPKQAAAIAYSIQRKNESMDNLKENLSLSELVKDSIYHLRDELGKDPWADDFADDVINDIENSYDVDIDFSDPLKYKDWASEVACEVSRQLNNKNIDESFDSEDQPFTKSQIMDELKRETDNFTIPEDTYRYGFEEEAEYAKEILSRKGYECDLGYDESDWVSVHFWKENVNESFDKTYQITVKYHNEPKEKIEARSAKDREDLEYQLNMDDEVEWYDFDENQFNESLSNKVKVGDTIKIIDMKGEPQYAGREGTVEDIDDAGQIHGTWGGCAIIPEEDEFEIITSTTMNEDAMVNLTSKEPEDEGEDEEIEEITESVLAGAVLTGLGTSLGAGIINVVQKLFKRDPSKKKSKWYDYKGYVIEKTPQGDFNIYDTESKEIGADSTFHTIKQAKKYVSDLKKGKISSSNNDDGDKVEVKDEAQSPLEEGYSKEGYSWDEVNGMIHIYEDGKLIDKYPDMESAEEAGWDLNELNESLDQMREKALKMKENSNAFAILYGYRTKDGKEVELEPEEFATEKEYKDRIDQITNSFTKLSDKDPRGNRYGYGKDIEFYTLYKGAVVEGLFDKKKIGIFNKHSGEGPKYAVLDSKKENEFIEKIKHIDPKNWEVCEYTEKNGKAIKGKPVDKYNQIMIDYQEDIKKRVADWEAKKAQKAKEDEEKRKAELKKQPHWTRTPSGAKLYRPIVDDEDAMDAILNEDCADNDDMDDKSMNESIFDMFKKNSGNNDGWVVTDGGYNVLSTHETEQAANNELMALRRENPYKIFRALKASDAVKAKKDAEKQIKAHNKEAHKIQKAKAKAKEKGTVKYVLRDGNGGRIVHSFDTEKEADTFWRNQPESQRFRFVKDRIYESFNNGAKWDMGSDKSKLSQEEINLLDELAQKLEISSPNGYKYVVQSTYEDYGAGMKWWNIICYNKKGNSWQVLNTKEWLDLMNTGDVDKVCQDVINGDYFQDKQKDINEMNMGELFNHMED